MELIVVPQDGIAMNGSDASNDPTRIHIDYVAAASWTLLRESGGLQLASSPDQQSFEIANKVSAAIGQDGPAPVIRMGNLAELPEHEAIDTEIVRRELAWLKRQRIATVLVASGGIARVIGGVLEQELGIAGAPVIPGSDLMRRYALSS